MADASLHTSVLLEEVVGLLGVKPGDRVIDATVDGGGHAAALLERIGSGGTLLGIERDPDLVAVARARFAPELEAGGMVLCQGSFAGLERIATVAGFNDADAILFDLGLSSYHLDSSGRGFSFRGREPLDMRFDPGDTALEPAARILDTWSIQDLTALFRDYGEERYSGRIARHIVEARPVTTTSRLLELITRALPGKGRPWAERSAARVFQALRIAVNRELDAVREALPQAVRLLRPSGRLAVISFHSLEDRIVKQFFTECRRAGELIVLTKRPIRPSDTEIRRNPRASSAKLRVAEKEKRGQI